MSQPAIHLQGLRKKFGSVEAVVNSTFTVTSGRVTGFLGPNGAGKTTTLRMLLGLVRPSSGSALIYGKPYHALPEPSRLVGTVLDIAGAHPKMTARQHLRTYSTMAGLSRTRVETVLAHTGSVDFADRRIGTFSTGMRQRLSLATALLGDPEILVLDEPSNGLDPAGIVWLRTFLTGFARAGGTVLLSSHALAEVEHISDDVVLIDKGRVLRTGTLAEIRTPAGSLEHAFLKATESGV